LSKTLESFFKAKLIARSAIAMTMPTVVSFSSLRIRSTGNYRWWQRDSAPSADEIRSRLFEVSNTTRGGGRVKTHIPPASGAWYFSFNLEALRV